MCQVVDLNAESYWDDKHEDQVPESHLGAQEWVPQSRTEHGI